MQPKHFDSKYLFDFDMAVAFWLANDKEYVFRQEQPIQSLKYGENLPEEVIFGWTMNGVFRYRDITASQSKSTPH